ncbi:MAG: TlpA family protein disulfide reductase [Agriterribacter sp.]
MKYASAKPQNFYYIKGLKGRPLNLSKGNVITMESQTPVYLIAADELQTPYVLFPGDSITIEETDGGNITFREKSLIRSNELNALRDMSLQFGSLRPLMKTTYITQQCNMKERDSIIENTFRNRKKFIQTYSRSHQLSEAFKNYAATILEYARINEKLYLYYPNFNRYDIRKYYTDSLKRFESYFTCNDCMENTLYTTALLHFLRISLRIKNPTRPYLGFNGLEEEELKVVFAMSDPFSQKAKEYIQAKAIQNLIHLQKNNFKEYNLLDRLQDTAYLTDLHKELVKFREVPSLEVSMDIHNQILLTNNFAYKTLGKIIEENRGKIVFIDIWATWCGPCIYEMPKSIELSEKYKGKLKVIFMSIDEDATAWQAYSNNNLKKHSSYLIKNGDNSILTRGLKITSIPRYILIGKDSKIISRDAPRPGDLQLKKLIEKYL